ncbi:MAG: hypothetical protein IPK80_34975 [Nannocystis sp.]|nr:hypothetical protein [Nannocystis sp.]
MSNIFVTFTSAAGQVRLRMPRSVVMVEIADDADTSTAVHVQTTIRRPARRARRRTRHHRHRGASDRAAHHLLPGSAAGEVELIRWSHGCRGVRPFAGATRGV